MSGLFEHIEMFDEGNKVANRQALAVANKRFNDTFASFLRQASSEKEFNGRLALVEQDIANMAADVANEYGGDAEKIAKAINATVKAAFDPTPSADEQPECENCGGHGCEQCDDDSDDYPEDDGPFIDKYEMPFIGDDWDYTSSKKERPEHLKAQDEVQLADEHSQVPPWLKKQDEDEDQEDGGNLRNKEAAAHTVKKKGDEFVVVEDGGEEAAGPFDSKEKAQARAKELNDLENLEKEAGFGDAVKGFGNKVKDLFNGQGQQAPQAPQAPQLTDEERRLDDELFKFMAEMDETDRPLGIAPSPEIQAMHQRQREREEMQMRRQKEEEARLEAFNQKKKDEAERAKMNASPAFGSPHNLYYRGSAITPAMAKALQLKHAAKPETGDSTEENESLPTGNEDAHDGPSPKIDKKKWKPNATNPDGNLKPIDTEGDKSPHPTRHMDIKDKPDYQNDDPWENDNNVWEREQLPTAKGDEAGFEGTRNIDQPTKAAETWHDKSTQANPVTKISLPDALAEKQSAMWDPGRPGRMILDALANEYPDIAKALDQAEGGDMQAIRQLVRSGLLQQAQELAFSLHEFDPNNYPQPDIPAEIQQGVAQGDPEAAQEYIRMFREDGGDELDAEATEPEIAPEEDMEEIIERGDDEGDRVEVIHEHDDEKESDEEESDEFDSFDELDEPTDEQLERLERGEEDPDEWL